MTLAVQSRNQGGQFEFVVAAEADLATIVDPKVGQFALALSEGTIHFHTGSAWQAIGGGAGGGAPTTADYLVGTAQGGLSAEIVAGTAPGGELGGTWASPTVDATHSGSTHGAAVTTHEAAVDPHTGYRLESADHTHASTGIQAGTITHAVTTGQTATDHHAAPAAGPDANVTVDAAGAAGTASTFARSAHGHQVVSDSGVASTQAFGDAATAGTSATLQRGGHKHAMPADPVTAHVAAADPHTGYVLESLLNAKGDLITASADNTPSLLTVGADDTILMADAAAGGGLKWVASATPSAVAAAAVLGTADTFTRGDHVHAHGTGYLVDAHHTQAHGASDHTDLTRSFVLTAEMATVLTGAVATNVGTGLNISRTLFYVDAASNDASWSFIVPLDWASGVITAQCVWSPSATDATPHTVRWNYTSKKVSAAASVIGAGTAALFTGASAARTVDLLVYDTATSTGVTPSAAGELFMLNVQRIGADGADTYVGTVRLHAIIITYTATQ